MIKAALWLVPMLCLSLVTPAVAQSPLPDDDRSLRHFLDRVSFGPAPGDLDRLRREGIDRYLDEQLAPDTLAEPPALASELQGLDTLAKSPADLAREYLPAPGSGPDADRSARQRARLIVQQAAEARFRRALESPRQLQEVMVDFWFNHFNVFAEKGMDRLWIGDYEAEAIRPHALGRFRDLLEATAKHPAMLFYLDNWQNTRPGARGPFHGLNENYARELMELHTLGVDGGYKQDDVVQLAKILTGWGFHPNPKKNGFDFYFDPARHDRSDKVLLGALIPASGIEEGEAALDLLARHPATAHHLAYQLAQYFVCDQPPASLVDRLASTYLKTDGDIRQVLTTLFHSPEFWAPSAMGAKFKTPYLYVLSAVRASGIVPTDPKTIQNALVQLGMPLYGCLTPDGYKNTREAWLSPDAMTRRLSLAIAIGSRRPPFQVQDPSTKGPLPVPVLLQTLGGTLSTRTVSALEEAPPDLRAAVLLGSPEFMTR